MGVGGGGVMGGKWRQLYLNKNKKKKNRNAFLRKKRVRSQKYNEVYFLYKKFTLNIYTYID